MITFDGETKSYADLKKVGSWVYSEDPTTDVICAAWGEGTAPIEAWWPGKNASDTIPNTLWQRLKEGVGLEAHKCDFEYGIWTNVLAEKYDWPLLPLRQFHDTMAVACYYGLPAALDKLCRALGFEGKDPEGGRLITKYSKLYLKTAKEEIPEEDLMKFVRYCIHDVKMEQSVSDWLGYLPDREIPNFILTQGVNDRGLYLDLEGIEAATEIADKMNKILTAQFRELTGVNPTQIAEVRKWCAGQGVELDNLKAETIEDLLEGDELPQGDVREALALRMQVNKASTKKLDSMARQRGRNGRARFQTRYHGALTGRETGSGFQPLNLNRGYEGMDPDQLVRDIMHRDPKWLKTLYGDPLEAIAKASRYWIKAEEGNKIIAGDFASIEAVVLACLAGEEWKVQAFRDGVKIYEFMADKIYDLAPGTVTKETHPEERQDGKTGELAFGYQGALGAWLKFDSSGRHSDERIIEICKAWRAEHPCIVDFWHDLERAAIAAVRKPGSVHYAGVTGFEVVDEWLTMILINGKRLWYYNPQLRATMPQWHKPSVHEKCRKGTCDCRPRPQVWYMAQKNGQWKWVSSYGGKWAENDTQATAREILVPCERRLNDRGYHVILSVYDEIVSEVPKTFGSAQEFLDIAMEKPAGAWCADWPIRMAMPWEGERYRK